MSFTIQFKRGLLVNLPTGSDGEPLFTTDTGKLYIGNSGTNVLINPDSLLSLNGLTSTSQTFATGTGGSDFNISSGASTHTFNLPTASATKRGLLTSSDWSTFNSKQNGLTIGNLSESTSSVLTITGGTGSIIGSGLTIQVLKSSGSQDGYLSSSDWNTFNAKQSGPLTSDVTTSGTTATIASNAVTFAKFQNISTARLLGRSTAGTGNVEQISIGTGLSLSGGTLSATGSGTVSSVTASSPLSSSGGSTPNITIQDAAADGSTKGAASFTASDFNSSSGNISIDYTNGQAASGSTKGFLTSADWTTFNNKESALTFNSPLSRSTNTISLGTVGIGNGGTGATTQTAAFNALAPTTTRGDLIVMGASDDVRLAIGSANTVLASNGTDPSWRTIVNADISSSAAIARSKIATGTASHVLTNDGSGNLSSEATLALTRGGWQQDMTMATLSSSGSQNPTLSTGLTRCTGAITFQGIQPPSGPVSLLQIIYNDSGGAITFNNQDGSVAGNTRIVTPNGANLSLADKQTAILFYNTTTTRWDMIAPSSRIIPLTEGGWGLDMSLTTNPAGSGSIINALTLPTGTIRLTTATSLRGVVSTGIVNGQNIIIINASASTTMAIVNNSNAAAAADRIFTPGGVDIQIPAQGSAILNYVTSSANWQVVASPFLGAKNVGSGSGVDVFQNNVAGFAQFKRLTPNDTTITISDLTGTNRVGFNVNPGNINISSLAGNLPVSRGGTGQTSFSSGNPLIYYDNGSGALTGTNTSYGRWTGNGFDFGNSSLNDAIINVANGGKTYGIHAKDNHLFESGTTTFSDYIDSTGRMKVLKINPNQAGTTQRLNIGSDNVNNDESEVRIETTGIALGTPAITSVLANPNAAGGYAIGQGTHTYHMYAKRTISGTDFFSSGHATGSYSESFDPSALSATAVGLTPTSPSGSASDNSSGGYNDTDTVEYQIYSHLNGSEQSPSFVSVGPLTGDGSDTYFTTSVSFTLPSVAGGSSVVYRNVNGGGFNEYQIYGAGFTDDSSGWTGGSVSTTPFYYNGGDNVDYQAYVLYNGNTEISVNNAAQSGITSADQFWITYSFTVPSNLTGQTPALFIQLNGGGYANWIGSNNTTDHNNPGGEQTAGSPGSFTTITKYDVQVNYTNGTYSTNTRTLVDDDTVTFDYYYDSAGSPLTDNATYTLGSTVTPTTYLLPSITTNSGLGLKTASPTSTFDNVSGSFAGSINTRADTYVLDASDYLVLADTSGATVTYTLPQASTCPGRIYIIKDKSENASANNIFVNAFSGDIIDNNITMLINTDLGAKTIQSDGNTTWWITSKY